MLKELRATSRNFYLTPLYSMYKQLYTKDNSGTELQIFQCSSVFLIKISSWEFTFYIQNLQARFNPSILAILW